MNEQQINKFTELANKVSELPHGALASGRLASKMNDRFQDQKWYVKLWRFRWYLKIPFDTVRNYFANRKIYKDSIYVAYSLAIGDAQYRMNWLYTLQETTEHLENKRKK